MAMARNRNSLAKNLQREKEEWPRLSNSYFIPVSEIRNLVKADTVKRELRRIYPKKDDRILDRYTDHICCSMQKIFTIVLCSSSGAHRKAICEIIGENITDDDLPLSRIYQRRSSSDPRNQRHTRYLLGKKDHNSCPLSDHKGCEIKALSHLQTSDIHDLCRDQWLALAPVFESNSESIPYHILDDSVVLPYIEDQETDPGKIKSGGYSEVWGVRIHPAHQDMISSTDPQGPLIAVKRLFSRKIEDFEKEKYMLEELTRKKHPHLVRLLTTYKLKDRYHLLCPYAKLNLRSYWNSNRMPNWDRETTLWTLTQLEGLASALDIIHNFQTARVLGSDHTDFRVSRQRPSMNVRMIVDSNEERYGRHGDLKPENILWSDDCEDSGGILQIADLGLGRFHRLESRSQQDPTTINGSPTYIPPELALKKLVSRAYDIWSFGCILLEFITWMLEGAAGVDKFANKRIAKALDGVFDDQFYMLFDSDSGQYGEVRPQVTAWIQWLRQGRSEMVRDLLNLVEKSMLRINSEDRIKSPALMSRLSTILQKGRSDSGYLLGV